MKKRLSITAVFIAIVIGAWVFAMKDQISDIESVCAMFTVGADIGGLEEIEKQYSVKLMGSFDLKDQSGAQQALFCAVLTMCDTSCWVEYRGDSVITSGVLYQ